MKTDEFVAMLARGAPAVDTREAERRYALALGWGACGAVLLMALWLGVRRDMSAAVWLPMFWVKLAFPAAVLAGALLLALRLSRPGVRMGRALLWVSAPAVLMWLLAAATLAVASADARNTLIFGVSWTVCPFYITTLSMPVWFASLWAMKGLAPTQPAAAGAAAGLVAGAIGALAYSLYCPEMAAPFLSIWYLLGMLIPALMGAVAGPLLLRW